MQSDRIRTSLTAGIAILIFSALATTAQAAGGPLWIAPNALVAGETHNIVSEHLINYQFKGTVASIECTASSGAGVILGGNPGTDYERVVLQGCFVVGKPECKATGLKPLAASKAGELIFNVLSVLAYPKGATEGESALDAFAPTGEAGSPNLLVEFELEGGAAACGLLNKVKVKLEAIGTEITIKGEKRRCAALAEVGKLVGGSPVLTKPGEKSFEVVFNLPSTPVKEAEVWEGGVFRTIKGEMHAGALGEVFEEGRSRVETRSPRAEFGWDL